MPITDVLSSAPTQPAVPAKATARATTAASPKAAVDVVDAAPTTPQVKAAVQQIQRFLAESARTIEFRVDDASGVPVVTVRDGSSGDVIRQIPNEETLHLAQMLKESSQTRHALVSLTV